MRYVLLILSAAFFANVTSAQNIDSVLALYKANYQQEKIHIHFDKNVYEKNETIRYKTYILAGGELSDYSRSLYLDWYDAKGNLLEHTAVPIFESSAKGSYTVPEKYKDKFIHVKAYTQWMLNFDSSFLYNKDIAINQSLEVSSKKITHAKSQLKFFPEGGYMYYGISSTIAFAATNELGEPVSIKGAIINSKKQFIDSIVSVHDGMGKLSLIPELNETYSCVWEDDFGNKYNTELPVAKNNGASFETLLAKNKILYEVKRTENVTDNFKQMHLVATINQTEVYDAKINLTKRKSIASEILTENLKTGLLQVTLFDADWMPIAERIVFINNHSHEFNPQINVITGNTAKRAKNIIEVNVADSILSNMSVSVTDASISGDQSYNIFSDFLLSGDIRGKIFNAAYYFSSDDDTVKNNLDLLMMTHGWRKINWEDILKNKMPVTVFAKDSDYLQIRGKVFTGGQVTLHPEQTIFIILQSGDSVKNKQFLMLPVKQDGSFLQRGAIFFDTVRVFYQLNGADKRIRDLASVGMQSPFSKLPVNSKFNFSKPGKPDDFLGFDSLYYANQLAYLKEYERLQKLYASATLKEVIVETKKKTAKEILDEKYATGLFAESGNAYAFDIINDQRAQTSLDIVHYLQNQVPGLSVSIPVLGANGATDANSDDAPDFNFRDGKPDIFIDEMPATSSDIQHIPMSNVAYIKVFKPPFMGSSGGGASGAIVIYTRKAEYIKPNMTKLMNSAILIGYSSYKEFYSPDYAVLQGGAPDKRTTLYWNPYILTDKTTHSVKMEFYNNDITKKYRIILEGINASGKMARIEKIVE